MKRKKMWFMLLVFIVLALGIFQVYSASYMWAQFKYQDSAYFVKRQLIFGMIGILMFLMAKRIDLEKLEKYHKWILIASFFLLVFVLIPGIGVERNGSRSWFKLASFYVQPSEIMKISMILTTASIMAKKKRITSFMKDLMPLLLLVMLGFGLIMLQPDFGSGIVMLCSIVMMVYVAGCPIKYFVQGSVMALVALVGLILSAPYRLKRITSFIDPWQDPLGSGFQIIQSLYAIAPGGLVGRGIMSSIQKQFYLPEPQTDFIFSIFAEEFGLLGSLFVIFLFFMIIYLGIEISKSSKSCFAGYVGFGIISLFAIQVAINLGVTVGLFPITGVPLLLFSYGGSSLVVELTMLGLLCGIK